MGCCDKENLNGHRVHTKEKVLTVLIGKLCFVAHLLLAR